MRGIDNTNLRQPMLNTLSFGFWTPLSMTIREMEAIYFNSGISAKMCSRTRVCSRTWAE